MEKQAEKDKMLKNINLDINKYKTLKEDFKYFSDELLLSIYKKRSSNDSIELLALEEELVSRKLISHSPQHEKLYLIKKNIFNKI